MRRRIKKFAEMGFSAIQFHDDDAVPNINDLTEEEIKEKAREVKKPLDKYSLKAEFVAPRLWMDHHTPDGGFMCTSAKRTETMLCGERNAPLTLQMNWAGIRWSSGLQEKEPCARIAKLRYGLQRCWWKPSMRCCNMIPGSGSDRAKTK